jgi:S1-C subfamily serine protease
MVRDRQNCFSLISDAGDAERPRPARPLPNDTHLLDAYSQAVINVVQTVAPAVIRVGPVGEQRGGSGSGFIITPDGFAVTNSHVVDGRPRLTAETDEGDRVSADVVGDDPATDLALLRLAGRDLPFTELGDSNLLQVGLLVIAMGSPLGLQSTVSTGVVSAMGRSMRGRDGRLIENVVQHAAPINPGNSGGPLVDSRGRVVGVNTAIIAFAQGLGFAIPSNTVTWVTGEFLQHGHVRRRQLGIAAAVVHLSRATVRQFDLLADTAVEVRQVQPGSVADAAGLKSGDLLVSLSGRIVANVDDIHRLLALPTEDASLEAHVIRGGRQLSLPVNW